MIVVMGLRKALRIYDAEIEDNRDRYPVYASYLRNLGFTELIEQVVSAVAMFPRSIDASKDMLHDLCYGIVNNLGVNSDRLGSTETANLAAMVHEIGREVLGQLEQAGYFYNPNSFTRYEMEQPHFDTDLTAVCSVEEINKFTFRVCIEEFGFEELEFAKPQLLQKSQSLIRRH